jgi:glycosyl transferase, family 25
MPRLIEHFGAAYVINLPERKDRLRSFRKELARAGWALGNSGVRLFSAFRFNDRQTFPTAQIRGCFHSHMGCLSDAHKSANGHVIVMEDDIALSPVMDEITPEVVMHMEAMPWDFLYFGHDDTGDIPVLKAAREKTIEFHEYEGAIKGAHFYAVNQRILERLLQHLDRVVRGREGDQEFGPMPIDGAFNIFRWKNPDVRTFIAAPKLGWQLPSRSDITPRGFDSIKLLRPLVAVYRGLKSMAMRG